MSASPLDPSLDDLLVHASWARTLARGLIADNSAADDLLQDAWVAALERPPQHAENLRGWLTKVLRNLARSRGRSNSRREAREARVALKPSQEAPSSLDLASKVETQRRLASAVLSLAEPYRSTVILRFYEELDASQIAARHGIAPSTARWRIKVGLDKLRDRFDRECGGDRGAWIALLTPIAGPGLAPHSDTIATATTLLSMKATTKTVALTAVALLGAAGLFLIATPLWGIGSRGAAPAPVTFSPLEDGSEPVAHQAPPESPRRFVAAAQANTSTVVEASANDRTTLASMHLVDREGRPVAGATVTSPRLASAGAGVVSGPDGGVALALPNLEERARVLIRIDHPKFVQLSTHNVIEPGRRTEFGEIVLQRAGAVTGRVLRADGRPARGAWVKLAESAFNHEREPGTYEMARHRRSEGSSWSNVDESGEFRLDRVPAGIIHLWAGHNEHLASLSAPVEIRSGMLSSGVEIRLGSLDLANFITGEVRLPDGTPAAHASVHTTYSKSLGGNGSRTFSADAEGRFRIATIPGASYRVSALDQGASHTSAEEVGLGAGDHIVLQLSHNRSLEITLTHDGVPHTEAEVWAAHPDSGRYVVPPTLVEVVDEQFAIPVPRSEFTVQVKSDGFELLELGPFDEASAPSTLTAELTKIAGLHGRVLVDGKPIAGARVSASPVARQTVETGGFKCLVNPLRRVEGVADDAGNFTLSPHEARAWIVRAEAPGHAPAERGPFEFDPAIGLEGIELSLTPGGSIEGRVLANGRAIAGLVVGASCGDGHPISTRTDLEGFYRFVHLMPGRWEVRQIESDLAPDSFAMTMWGEALNKVDLPWNCVVSEGEVTRHDIVSGPRPTLVGRLTFDGRGPGAWSAKLINDADPIVRHDAVRLAPDGSFTIEMPSEGRYRLMIVQDQELCGVMTEIDLLGPRSEWTRDLASGAIEISGLPEVGTARDSGAPTEVHVALAQIEDMVVIAPIPTGISETHTIPAVPAGEYSLRGGPARSMGRPEALQGFGRLLIEFQVEQGKQCSVELPANDD